MGGVSFTLFDKLIFDPAPVDLLVLDEGIHILTLLLELIIDVWQGTFKIRIHSQLALLSVGIRMTVFGRCRTGS